MPLAKAYRRIWRAYRHRRELGAHFSYRAKHKNIKGLSPDNPGLRPFG